MIRSGQRSDELSQHVAKRPRIAALRKITGTPISNSLSINLSILL